MVLEKLLQHERSGMESLVSGGAREKASSLPEVAKSFLGEMNGRLANAATRDEILKYEMDSLALHLTQRRVVTESMDGATPGPATSIFKVVSTELEQDYNDLLTRLHGSRAFGIDENFTQPEREMNNRFFFSRAASIYSGSNEIQRNIIAKRVLGLPD